MRTLIPLAIALTARAAAAEPCSVSIARAPDDVRAEIERQVAAEPTCRNTLEVRVVPTDGGLYLFARDERGRVRERIVPDAKSAGVLVASWVADDTVTAGPPPAPPLPPPAPVVAPVTPVAPPPTPAASPLVTTISAPGMAPLAEGGLATSAAAGGRWLSLGAMTDFDNNHGARAEGDVLVHGAWRIAASLAVTTNELQFMMPPPYNVHDVLDTVDTRAVASAAYTFTSGRWQLRLSGGLGLMYTQVHVTSTSTAPRDGDGWFATAETAAMLSRSLDERWAIAVGPVVTWLVQNYKDDANTALLIRRDAEITGFAGLRYRL